MATKTSAITLGRTRERALAALAHQHNINPLEMLDRLVSLATAQPRMLHPSPIVITVDAARPLTPFVDSKALELRPWRGTEAALVDEAARLSKLTLAEIAHDGTIAEAKRIIQQRARLEQTATMGGDRRGIKGILNDAYAEAWSTYIATKGKPPTPTQLAHAAKGFYRSARTWIEKYHPETLTLKAEAEAPPPAAAPAPAPSPAPRRPARKASKATSSVRRGKVAATRQRS